MNKQNKKYHSRANTTTVCNITYDAKRTCGKDRKNRNDDQQVGKRKQDTVCDRLPYTFKSFAMHMRLSAGIVEYSNKNRNTKSK